MKNIFNLVFLILLSACSRSNDFKPDYPEPPKPIVYTDDQIIEMTQKDALKYFWDYAESNSKLARERYHTDNPGQDASVVTTGGSGFGSVSDTHLDVYKRQVPGGASSRDALPVEPFAAVSPTKPLQQATACLQGRLASHPALRRRAGTARCG